MCELRHTSAVVQKMQRGQKTPSIGDYLGPMPTSSTFKAVARRLTAMPEVLPVQFMQMLCSNGVKLSLDLTVADECDSNHEKC